MPKISNQVIAVNKKSGALARIGMTAKKWAAAFISPADEITQHTSNLFSGGSTTVASLLSSGNKQARTRHAIYDKWSQMESDSVISTGIGLLVTSALGGHETSGDVVFIEKSHLAQGDKRLAAIADEISADLTSILNNVAYTIAFTSAIYGDAYARIYSDDRGVVDLHTDEMVRPQLVQPFERGSRTVGFAVYTGSKHFERLDVSQLARCKMPRTQWIPQYGVIEKSLRLALTEDDQDNLPIMPSMVGGSLIYNAEEAYDNLSASLVGLVGQRWKDSIDEETIGVNLDSMTLEQQERFVASVTQMLSRSKATAESAVANGKPILERIRHILPVFSDKQVVTMSGVNNQRSAGAISIDDVMLHARLLAGALGVDLSMLGFADQMSGGLGEGGFFRISAQAAERSRVIRKSLSDFYNQVIDIHTMRRYNIVFSESERPWTINFYGSISALETERQKTKTDTMNASMLMVQAMQMMKDLGADKEIMESFLSKCMMLDEDQAKLFAKIVDVKPDDGSGGGIGDESDREADADEGQGKQFGGGSKRGAGTDSEDDSEDSGGADDSEGDS